MQNSCFPSTCLSRPKMRSFTCFAFLAVIAALSFDINHGMARGIVGMTVQDDEDVILKRGDWVKFGRNDQKYPASGRIHEIKANNMIVVVETMDPETGETVRLALRRIGLTKITEKEAEKLAKDAKREKARQFEVGQSVLAFYKGKWISGQVLEQRNKNYVTVRHGQRGKKEMIARRYPIRAIKDISEDRAFPEYKRGDEVLARMSRGASEPTWESGEVTQVAGTYVYVRLDKNMDDDKEDLQFLRANLCHKTTERVHEPINEAEEQFKVGDIVQFRKAGAMVEARITKIGSEWITIRYFDQKREKHYNRRMKPSQLVIKKSKDQDQNDDTAKKMIPIDSEQERRWTSADGIRTFNGKLVMINGETIQIDGDNGRKFDIELGKLSQQDIDYVTQVKKRNPGN